MSINNCTLTEDQIAATVAFHGHHCPGLSYGIRAAEWCLRELGKAGDEDIVALVETDMCAVDAIQFLTGCTFGKGNFVFHDYGKVAFSFFRRSDNKGARLVLNPGFAADLRVEMESLGPDQKEESANLRKKMTDRVMTAPLDEIFLIGVPLEDLPERARLRKTISCQHCGEGVMESRLRWYGKARICIPCFEKMTASPAPTSESQKPIPDEL